MVEALVTLFITLITWGVRLEIKMHVIEAKHIDLKELINTKLDVVLEKFNTVAATTNSIDTRLERVERHVLNGHDKDK